MVKYTCPKCDKIFDKKSNYDTHMNKKKPCKPDFIDNTNKTCVHCAKIFSTTTGLSLHKSICPVIKQNVKSLNLEIAQIDYYTRQLDFYFNDESKARTKMINEKDQLIVQRKILQDKINLIKS
jgi:hypothetical protein